MPRPEVAGPLADGRAEPTRTRPRVRAFIRLSHRVAPVFLRFGALAVGKALKPCAGWIRLNGRPTPQALHRHGSWTS